MKNVREIHIKLDNDNSSFISFFSQVTLYLSDLADHTRSLESRISPERLSEQSR